jgi:hypothetical protein
VRGDFRQGRVDDGGSALVESAAGESTAACTDAEVDVLASLSFLVAMACCVEQLELTALDRLMRSMLQTEHVNWCTS